VGAALKTAMGNAADARASVARELANKLFALAPDDEGLLTVDTVSLTDLAAFLVRGAAYFKGELVFQQRLAPYLIDSAFSHLLSLSLALSRAGSKWFGWFGCVVVSIFMTSHRAPHS